MTHPRLGPDTRQRRGQRLTFVTALAGLIMLAVLAFWQAKPELVDNALGPAPLGFGDPTSPVQVVAFLSPTCPHCAKFELTVGKDLYARAAAGELYYAVYLLMLEEGHELYTLALFCAYDGGSFPLFLILHYQNYYLHEHLGLRDLAERAGIDPETFAQCLKTPATVQRMRATLRWTKRLGVSGTPTFFVKPRDGRKFRRIEGNRGPTFWRRLLGITPTNLRGQVDNDARVGRLEGKP